MAQHENILSVMLHGRGLEWTVLRWRKTAYEVEASNRLELDLPEDADLRDPAAVSDAIKTALQGVKGRLTVVIHTDQVLLRAVDLPPSEPDELAGMVELQVDKFAPFPIEHMAVGHEVLGSSGSSMRVLVAACKRSVVEELGALFTAAGHPPARIDVAVAGWWRLLRDRGAVPAAGSHGLLLLDESGTELVITQNGLPVVVRALGRQQRASEEDYFAELAEETAYTLTSLESEWGAMATPDITVWHRGPVPALLLDKLQTECAVQVVTHSLDEVPSLVEGAAWRSTADGEHRPLDLCPPEWKTDAAAQKSQRYVLAFVVSALLVWVVALAGLFSLAHFDRQRVERLRAAIAATEGPAEEARLLRQRVESLEQYADRTHSALEVLREITVLLPGGVDLTSLTYRKGGQVNLRGESPAVPAIYDFFEALEASELFVEVKPEGVTQAPGGRRNPDFRLTARLPGEAP